MPIDRLGVVVKDTFSPKEHREHFRQVHEAGRGGTRMQVRKHHPSGVVDQKSGIAGAVMLDSWGHSGMMGNRFGPVGDAPGGGAGTCAEDVIRVSGDGAVLASSVADHNIASMIRYGGLSLGEAANAVVMGRLTALGGTGGVIALDRSGAISMPFNTSGMYRGALSTDGALRMAIFAGER